MATTRSTRHLRGKVMFGKLRRDGQLDGRSKPAEGVLARGFGGFGREVMRVRGRPRHLIRKELTRLAPLYVEGGRFSTWTVTG